MAIKTICDICGNYARYGLVLSETVEPIRRERAGVAEEKQYRDLCAEHYRAVLNVLDGEPLLLPESVKR